MRNRLILLIGLLLLLSPRQSSAQVQIDPGIPQVLLNTVSSTGDSDHFALPTVTSVCTWQSSFGSAPDSLTLQLKTSNDNVTFATVDTSTSTTSEARTFSTAARFVLVRLNALSGGDTVSVNIVCKQPNAQLLLTTNNNWLGDNTFDSITVNSCTGCGITLPIQLGLDTVFAINNGNDTIFGNDANDNPYMLGYNGDDGTPIYLGFINGDAGVNGSRENDAISFSVNNDFDGPDAGAFLEIGASQADTFARIGNDSTGVFTFGVKGEDGKIVLVGNPDLSTDDGPNYLIIDPGISFAFSYDGDLTEGVNLYESPTSGRTALSPATDIHVDLGDADHYYKDFYSFNFVGAGAGIANAATVSGYTIHISPGPGGAIFDTLTGTGTQFACLDSNGVLVRSATACGS